MTDADIKTGKNTTSVTPGDVANFITEAVNIREAAIEFWEERTIHAYATATPEKPVDVKAIVASAIDSAIGGTLGLFSNRYPETIVDTRVSHGEDGVKQIQIVVSDELNKLYFDQVNS